MLSTFARYLLIPREPRNQLQEGITTYYTYKINRHHSLPAQVTPDIPAAAPDFALQTLQFPADATQQEILASPARRVVLCCTAPANGANPPPEPSRPSTMPSSTPPASS